MLKSKIMELRELTGCSIINCKNALLFCEKHSDCTPIGYLRAVSLAVSTPKFSFYERVKWFSSSDIV